MKIKFSVVVPILNEEEVIDKLYERLTIVMEQLNQDYEIIFVDDNSTDKSFEIIKNLRRKDNRVKIIRFSRNFGHHIAISAGLDYSQGEAVILMDGDLQDKPEDIPLLYEKFKEGYDIVYAIAKTRKDGFFKKLSSRLFHACYEKLADTKIHPGAGIFRIISRRVVDLLKKCPEKSKFIAGLISWVGFSSTGVYTERDQRFKGKTKYNILKSLQLAITGIVSFSSAPLKIISYLGFFISFFSFIIGGYMLFKKIFFGMAIIGYASIIVSIFFLGGVQLVVMGIVGEYISRIYTEVQNRPVYIIEEKLGVE